MNKKIILPLKYRPKNFEELIGQESMVLSLKSALKKNKLHNAYILTGIRGVGKTTTARIISKAINCNKHFEHGAQQNNEVYCECDDITKSKHIDVLEMDAASKTGVDDIRDLLESSKYHPSVAKYKVFIIDEAHMLSKQAFNALLKTLEEPPDHLKFILATTEIKKIPITILSRCQRFDLRRIKIEEMIKYLTDISNKEDIKIDNNAIQLIAKSSEGSVRDALSILDQANIINIEKNNISAENIRKMLGLADKDKLLELITNIIDGNEKTSSLVLDEIFDYGSDPQLVLENLLELVYLISREQTLGNISSDLSISENESKQICELSKKIDLTYTSILWHYLLKGIEDLKLFPDSFIALQMLTTRLCRLKDMPDPQKVREENVDLNVLSSKEESVVKTQIKTIVQEKKIPESKKNDNKIINFVSKINNIEDLINIAIKKQEIELKKDLESNVRVVDFKQGKINIEFNSNLSKNFPKLLTNKLFEWTGKKWVISFTNDKGDRFVNKEKNFEDIKSSEVYKSVMESFPDAEFINKQNVNEDD
tara:strand:- start:28016 stop:29632 length:1617 start_codon:yes stop_codon:yes gene_type:complete